MIIVDSWRVTGSLADPVASGSQSVATNLETTLKEGRVSITLTSSLYKSLSNNSPILASRSQLITGRYFNEPPYFVVTAVSDINSNGALKGSSEGDTGGTADDKNAAFRPISPDVNNPAGFVRTILGSRSICKNSSDALNVDPKRDVPSAANLPAIPNHSYAKKEQLVWIFEAPCVTPGLVPDPAHPIPVNVDIHSQGDYLHSGSLSLPWSKGDQRPSF